MNPFTTAYRASNEPSKVRAPSVNKDIEEVPLEPGHLPNEGTWLIIRAAIARIRNREYR
jgi:hypothetical protein